MIKILKIPFVRHLLAAVFILFIGYHYGTKGKASIQGELNANKSEILELRLLVSEIAKQPKNSVKNIVTDVKVKDGSTLDFAPKTHLKDNDTINNDIDSEPKEFKVLSKREKRKLERFNKFKERQARKDKKQKDEINKRKKKDR